MWPITLSGEPGRRMITVSFSNNVKVRRNGEWVSATYPEWLLRKIERRRIENGLPKPGTLVEWTPPPRSLWQQFLDVFVG